MHLNLTPNYTKTKVRNSNQICVKIKALNISISKLIRQNLETNKTHLQKNHFKTANRLIQNKNRKKV